MRQGGIGDAEAATAADAGHTGMQHAHGLNAAIPPETLAPPSLLGFNLNKIA